MNSANVLEQLVFGNLGYWGLLLIPFIAGLFVSFFSEVVNKVTPANISANLILLVVSTITCALLSFVFPIYYGGFSAFSILMLLLNIAVSFLFYPLVGKKLVGKIFQKFEDKFDDAINKV
jgi:hypothetical protein